MSYWTGLSVWGWFFSVLRLLIREHVGHTSPTRDSVFGFQHKMRLSLPQLSNKSESLGHHASDRIPLQTTTHTTWWNCNFQTQESSLNKCTINCSSWMTIWRKKSFLQNRRLTTSSSNSNTLLTSSQSDTIVTTFWHYRVHWPPSMKGHTTEYCRFSFIQIRVKKWWLLTFETLSRLMYSKDWAGAQHMDMGLFVKHRADVSGKSG